MEARVGRPIPNQRLLPDKIVSSRRLLLKVQIPWRFFRRFVDLVGIVIFKPKI